MDRKTLKDFINASSMYVLKLKNEKIICHPTIDATGYRYRSLQWEQHLKYLNTEIRSKSGLRECDFNDVYSFFFNKQSEATNKPLFAKYGGKHLVNKYFTQGIQKVPPNKVHVFKTVKRLHVYVAKNDRKTYQLKSLKLEYRTEFRKYILQANKEYKVSPNSFYFVIAPCHTIFTKKVVSTIQHTHAGNHTYNIPIRGTNQNEADNFTAIGSKPREPLKYNDSKYGKYPVEVRSSSWRDDLAVNMNRGGIIRPKDYPKTIKLPSVITNRSSGAEQSLYSARRHVAFINHLSQQDRITKRAKTEDSRAPKKVRFDFETNTRSEVKKSGNSDVKRDNCEEVTVIGSSPNKYSADRLFNAPHQKKPQQSPKRDFATRLWNSLRREVTESQSSPNRYSTIEFNNAPHQEVTESRLSLHRDAPVRLFHASDQEVGKYQLFQPNKYSTIEFHNAPNREVTESRQSPKRDPATGLLNSIRQEVSEIQPSPNRNSANGLLNSIRQEVSEIQPSRNRNSATGLLNSIRQEVSEIQPSPNRNCASELHNTRRQENIITPPVVAGIRMECQIESYQLLLGSSTLNVLPDWRVTGEFTMVNDNRDPRLFHYKVEDNEIAETATFNNGKTFKTRLPVEKELLYWLLKEEREREKVIVNYFFDLVFEKVKTAYETIKTAYEKFDEMRNIDSIGSCVPAVVKLDGSEFDRSLPDAYIQKVD